MTRSCRRCANFLADLVDWGVRLHAIELNGVIDIDVAEDLEAARLMLERERRDAALARARATRDGPRAGCLSGTANSPPARLTADAAILDLVLTNLADARYRARQPSSAAEFARSARSPRCALILAMCQGEAGLATAGAAQKDGALVINSPQAIRSCYRDRLGAILNASGGAGARGLWLRRRRRIDRGAIGSARSRIAESMSNAATCTRCSTGDVRSRRRRAALAIASAAISPPAVSGSPTFSRRWRVGWSSFTA